MDYRDLVFGDWIQVERGYDRHLTNEVTMVEGKPYHAKTYDKNGWNWPNIALWLDVEIPHELVEQITDKWFEENEQRRTKSKSST